MQIFGLEITGEHARIIGALAGGIIATAGFIAGRWSSYRRHVRFLREDLVGTSLMIEWYGVRHTPGAPDRLHIVTQGGSLTLESFFRSPELARYVQAAAHKHPGLVLLKNPVAQRMMMEEGKDAITGLDPRGNVDFIYGRPTQDDDVLFGFAAYREKDHDSDGLHDQVARLVLMVVAPHVIEKMCDPAYVSSLTVAHSGYQPRCARLHDFACEWQRLRELPTTERRSGRDKIWQTTVRTVLR